MYKVIAAVIVAAFAFGSTATFAQSAGKSEELTMEQRAEMRERAARLKAQGPQVAPVSVSVPVPDKVEKKAQKAKSSAVRHTHKAKHATVKKMHTTKHKVAHKKHKGKKVAKRTKKARNQV